jgi:MarR family transcriptional regulator for hemolysin
MQSLLAASNSEGVSEAACADDLIETVPLVMRVIRGHLRRHRSGLTIAQFRTLWFVSTAANQSLSAAADFIGLSLPAMSRLVEGMVEHGLMERRPCPDDRRHVRLSVTPAGESALGEARQLAQAGLSEAVTRMTPGQREAIVKTMTVLRDVFTSELDGS